MSSGAPPLRFLALVLGGWVCVRVFVLMPEEADAIGKPVRLVPSASASTPALRHHGRVPDWPTSFGPPLTTSKSYSDESSAVWFRTRQPDPALLTAAEPTAQTAPPVLKGAPPPFPDASIPAAGVVPTENRWSFSAWAFVRRGDAPQLAAGGVLGGSQAGARVSYKLREGLALTGRIYAPLRSRGAEAAGGLEWQPSASLPVRLLAERRQALDERGRSAFAAMAYGGVSDVRLGSALRLDAYGQAGLVGLRSRDAFVDGAVRVGLPVAKDLSIGLGLWGAAQPGVERLDAGPQITLRFPLERANIRLSADWRVRLAGDAEPGSGPALTLSTDF